MKLLKSDGRLQHIRLYRRKQPEALMYDGRCPQGTTPLNLLQHGREDQRTSQIWQRSQCLNL